MADTEFAGYHEVWAPPGNMNALWLDRFQGVHDAAGGDSQTLQMAALRGDFNVCDPPGEFSTG